jgi:ferredoxin
MPTVQFEGTEVECEQGALLRDVLLDAGESPHNGGSALLNCHGFGTCGTCAVEVEGEVSEPTRREQRRIRFPPHTPESGLRLACQTRVQGDLTVTKHERFWGQHVPEAE